MQARPSTHAQIAELQKRGPMDIDLAAVVPALNTLRDIRGGYDERDASMHRSNLTFGLYQGYKLGSAASDAYIRALNGLLLPRMLARIEMQMLPRMQNPDFLYQALKVYLILGRRGPLDRELVMQWFSADLLATYPTEDQTHDARSAGSSRRRDAATAADPIGTERSVDCAGACQVLNREPLAEYSYNRIMRSKRVTAIPTWTVAENGGPGSGRVFQLRSGKALDTGVAGIYTWAGYHQRLPATSALGHTGYCRGWLGARPSLARRRGHVARLPRNCAAM